MLIVQPARYESWGSVRQVERLADSEAFRFNNALFFMGISQNEFLRNNLDSKTISTLLYYLDQFPFLIETGVRCNNSSIDRGGLYDSVFFTAVCLLRLGLVEINRRDKTIEYSSPENAIQLLSKIEGCNTYGYLYSAVIPALELPSFFAPIALLSPVVPEEKIHWNTALKIAVCQYAVMRALMSVPSVTNEFLDQVLQTVSTWIGDGHIVTFLSSLGLLSYLLINGIGWSLITKDTWRHPEIDMSKFKQWAIHLVKSYSMNEVESTSVANFFLAMLSDYPNINMRPFLDSNGYVKWTIDKDVSSALSIFILETKLRALRHFNMLEEILDQQVYGSITRDRGVEAAKRRVINFLKSEECTSKEVCLYLTMLWERRFYSLVCNILNELDSHLNKGQLAKNIFAALPSWEKDGYDAILHLFDVLPKILSGIDDQNFIIPSQPLEIVFRSKDLEDGEYHDILRKVLHLSRMLHQQRIDRALELLDELIEALRNKVGYVEKLSDSVKKAGTTFSEECEAICENALRVLNGDEPIANVLTQNDEMGYAVIVKNMRCISCFYEWLKSCGYVLKTTMHATRTDGAEELSFEILSLDEGIVHGKGTILYIHSPCFFTYFRKHHADKWDKLYVPENEREIEDDPQREFSVAIDPVRILCSEKLARLLRNYRGKYHGMIPQRAVYAYRVYCSKNRYW